MQNLEHTLYCTEPSIRCRAVSEMLQGTFIEKKYLFSVVCLQTSSAPTYGINMAVIVVRMYIISFLYGVLSVMTFTLCCIVCEYEIWNFLQFLFKKLAHLVRLPNLLFCSFWTQFLFDDLTCCCVGINIPFLTRILKILKSY
jgi:hypothetical protein